jgi:hypothetical protein
MGDALLFPCFVLCWIGFKLLRAVGTTEVISFPGVLELVSRRGRIYRHTANGILYTCRRIGNIFHFFRAEIDRTRQILDCLHARVDP